MIILAIVAAMAMIGFVAQAHNVPPVILFGLWMVLFIAHTLGIIRLFKRTATARKV